MLCALTIVACSQKQILPATSAPTANAGALPAIEIQQLRSGIWVHTSYHKLDSGIIYPSNGVIVREGEQLLLIDPAWGAAATKQLLLRIQREIGLPVKRAISTHFHGDRTLGVDVLAEAGIDVFAHPQTLELAASHGMPVPKFPLPELEPEGASVALGSVEVFYPGAGHAQDNIMVWLPKEKILYSGCAMRDMASNTLGNVGDADLLSWPIAIRRAQERYAQAEIVIPGHGEVGDARQFGHMFHLFETVKQETR